MTKLTLEQQELLFANDCKLINLRYEYHGYTGTEKWAIVTELAEEELWVKYPDVIRRYTPFILLSMAQGEVIDESYRNNDKYEKRAKRTIDVYGYEDDISEQFHRELITPFVDPFEQAEEERIEEEKEQLRQLEIAKVRKVLEMISEQTKEYFELGKRNDVREHAKRLRRQFLRYKDAEIVYSIHHKKLLEMANKAGAIYRIDGTVLINRDIFDQYLEQFHEPSTLTQAEEKQ